MLLVLTAVCILLCSNIWLLRELEAIRARLDGCKQEVTLLDHQLCRLMVEMGEMRERGGVNVRDRHVDFEREFP